MKLALIPPHKKDDYLMNTVIDGLLALEEEGERLEFFLPEEYPNPFPKEEIQKHVLSRDALATYAEKAELIIWSNLKNVSDLALMERINRWDKTIVLDGSEWGKDRRFDFDIQKATLADFHGNAEMTDSILNICPLYFRREKPYVHGIIPFPFGIERRYTKYVDSVKEKDIDFVCIWGQEEHPKMRRFAREILESFCEENGFTYRTKQTKGFDFSLERTAGRDEFYEILSRAKVGISIGGGGFDTVRFWEILGNNCLVLTERIDIYEPDSDMLNYRRIYQFNNLFDFEHQLKSIAEFLKNEYRKEDLASEYQKIIAQHSTEARVRMLLEKVQEKELI